MAVWKCARGGKMLRKNELSKEEFDQLDGWTEQRGLNGTCPNCDSDEKIQKIDEDFVDNVCVIITYICDGCGEQFAETYRLVATEVKR